MWLSQKKHGSTAFVAFQTFPTKIFTIRLMLFTVLQNIMIWQW